MRKKVLLVQPIHSEGIELLEKEVEVIGRHGVGVDNLEEPPPSDHPLFGLENIVLSPHMASLTRECVVTMARVVAQGVLDVLGGKRPQYIVNPDSLRNK